MQRRTKRGLASLGTLVLAGGLIAACGATGGAPAAKPATKAGSAPSAKTATAKQAPVQLVAASASQGGANYLIMSGWAQIVNHAANVNVRVEATGGPAANMKLLQGGNADIGVLSSVVAREGWDGTGWSKGKKLHNERALFALNDLFMDGVALKSSGISNIDQLNGKVVTLGPAGGTPNIMVRRVFQILGIHPSQIVPLSQNGAINALENGQVSAVILAGAYPRPAYVRLMASHPVNFIHIPIADVHKVLKAFPALHQGVIPAHAYKYLTHNEVTLEDRYMYAVRANLPSNVAYEITKATIDHFKAFQKVHKSIASVVLKTMGQVSIPLDPGAVRALRAAHIPIPASALPPGTK